MGQMTQTISINRLPSLHAIDAIIPCVISGRYRFQHIKSMHHRTIIEQTVPPSLTKKPAT
jgi:hypothetical protein